MPYRLGNGWSQKLLWFKETLHSEKNCFLRLNTVTFKEKMFFWGKLLYFGLQSFLRSCYFTKIFVHLSVIAAVCYFSVYKLTRWDPGNFYLFKFNNRNTRKRCELSSKLRINTVESLFGVFIVDFEHISHSFLVFLLLNLND